VRILALTDLDGTLLDAHTYDWSPARPALAELRRRAIPLVICTSKTRAEVDVLRHALDHRDPFIVENGGAIHVPAGAVGARLEGSTRHGGYDVIEIGAPYSTLVDTLRTAAARAGVAVRGWHAMDEGEVAARCEMSPDAARLAMTRAHDEPFVIVDERPESAARLGVEVARLGARLTRGDRFFHILGAHDKGTAARRIIELYTRGWGAIATIAVGDAMNDVPMLALADVAVVIDSPQAADVVTRVPGARRSTVPGPAGWNTEMLAALAALSGDAAAGPTAGPSVDAQSSSRRASTPHTA
jgi:mannosyl-3-phosphoglycerate phosphatase